LTLHYVETKTEVLDTTLCGDWNSSGWH